MKCVSHQQASQLLHNKFIVVLGDSSEYNLKFVSSEETVKLQNVCLISINYITHLIPLLLNKLAASELGRVWRETATLQV